MDFHGFSHFDRILTGFSQDFPFTKAITEAFIAPRSKPEIVAPAVLGALAPAAAQAVEMPEAALGKTGKMTGEVRAESPWLSVCDGL